MLSPTSNLRVAEKELVILALTPGSKFTLNQAETLNDLPNCWPTDSQLYPEQVLSEQDPNPFCQADVRHPQIESRRVVSL